MEKNIKNILIVKNRAMGDSIMGLSTVSYLRGLYPESKIYYALPGWIAKLYKNVKTDADEVIAFDLKGMKDWFANWKKLDGLNIDLVYEMHQSGRTAKFFKFYTFWKRIPYFFHNHHLKSGTKVFDQGVIKAVIQRDLDGVYTYLGNEDGYPKYLDFEPLMKPLSGEWIQEKKIIFGVVATRETKMWPLNFYVSLARMIYEYNPKIKIEIPLSQSSADLKIKEQLNELGLPNNTHIVHYGLDVLPEKIAQAKLYIGNDTGIKHLAIATGVKSYTLFGPEPPNEWHPYDEMKHPYFYREGLECRTRDAHYCGLSTCDSMICLNEIRPEFVFSTIKRDLNEFN
ncbi:glycosyltransferase family 9 protein [Bacteriovorax sp. BSW11_IV]|uniref:glycosyltransferase family 9 protein n=1 Tax=Bacteriovorax sp. BSW11_IV TaxID=1353529 RepID=UPI0018CAFF89|nr:glycosyltransferase family 9 protein [Bacteriovorax sp. BSW11_IV]